MYIYIYTIYVSIGTIYPVALFQKTVLHAEDWCHPFYSDWVILSENIRDSHNGAGQSTVTWP